MSREPMEIVEELWQRIWMDDDLDDLGDLVADPYVRHTRDGTARVDPKQYAASVAEAVKVVRGTRVVIDEMVTVGDKVWSRMTLHAVNLNLGEEVTITWLGVYRIADDRVAESWVLHEAGLDWSRG